MCEHAWAMETCYLTNYILPHCRRFRYKICQKKACGSFNEMFERKIQTHRRWEWQLLLWNHTQMELRSKNIGHFYAWIHQKTAVEIQAHHATIQNCPNSPEPKKFGTDAQSPLPMTHHTCKLTDNEIEQVQNKLGSILYNARALDVRVFMALSTIASEQTKETERTLEKAYQVLDYLATHPNKKVRFGVSKMVMNIHSDSSYLSKPNARSRACGIFFMGELPTDGNPSKLTALFTRYVLFCDLLSHPRPKQN